jgi:betaine-homocysteine S-methyltransferase
MMETVVKSLGERLQEGCLLVAEGYVFELERRGFLKAGPFVPEVVLEFPQAVKDLHVEFARAGSDVVVACMYYGHRAKLASIGREDLLEKLNLKAVALAKEVAGEYGALTAGDLSNTWEYDPLEPDSKGVVRAIFEEQVGWATQVGVDLVIAETFSHLGEALIALEVIKEAGLPAVITMITPAEKSCDGYTWEDVCKTLEDNGADVVGLNCGRGPETMMPLLKRIRDRVSGHVAALPVPYRTTPRQPVFQKLRFEDETNAFPVALDPFLLTRYEMADFAVAAREMGVDYIGICCGAGPHHVRAMAEALGRSVPASEYSPAMELHPVFGDEDYTSRHYVECLFGEVDPGSA